MLSCSFEYRSLNFIKIKNSYAIEVELRLQTPGTHLRSVTPSRRGVPPSRTAPPPAFGGRKQPHRVYTEGTLLSSVSMG